MKSSAFDKQDEILDKIEPYFLSLAGEAGLKNIKTGRWHWDTPSFSLAWEGNDGLQRSICSILVDDSVRIECNAWSEGGVRKWKYLCIGHSQVDENIKSLIEAASPAGRKRI